MWAASVGRPPGTGAAIAAQLPDEDDRPAIAAQLSDKDDRRARFQKELLASLDAPDPILLERSARGRPFI